jgi:hypothetical protein
MSLVELPKIVIDEAMKPTGTWTYGFLSNITRTLNKCTEHEFEHILQELINFIGNEGTQVLQVFKISQLISSVKIQNPKKGLVIYERNRDTTMKRAKNLPDTPLTQPTKRLINSIFSKTHVRSFSSGHLKAFSTEPKLPNDSQEPFQKSILENKLFV